MKPMTSEVPTLDERVRRRLAEIANMEPTVDLTKRDSYSMAAGWNVDAREIHLPSEAPGAPAPDGTFATACGILREYSFPPKRLIRGTFDHDHPLDNRAMLLNARFLWLRFELPVRVSRVIDERRETDAGPEQVWGYSYFTLAGHLERGEITFEIIKQVASGDVRFRIHSFSQTDHIPNMIYRWGFKLIGRRLQRRFAEKSLENMQLLVTTALASHTPV